MTLMLRTREKITYVSTWKGNRVAMRPIPPPPKSTKVSSLISLCHQLDEGKFFWSGRDWCKKAETQIKTQQWPRQKHQSTARSSWQFSQRISQQQRSAQLVSRSTQRKKARASPPIDRPVDRIVCKLQTTSSTLSPVDRLVDRHWKKGLAADCPVDRHAGINQYQTLFRIMFSF